MALIRQIAIMPDPYAYATWQTEGTITKIGTGAGSNAWLGLNSFGGTAGSGLNGTIWKNIRVTQMSESADRTKIIEESIDAAAPSSVYAGTNSITGTIEGSFMLNALHVSGLLEAMMGAGSSSSGTYTVTGDPSATNFTTKYQMSMSPATIAIRTVDEQARNPSDNSVGLVKVYRGVGVSGAEITIDVKNYASFKANWIARRAETYKGSELTASYVPVTGQPSLFYNSIVKFGNSVLRAKTITINVTRPINTDLFYIGSQFLQDLTYNGITELGGTLTLGAPEYDSIKYMLSGSSSDSVYTLDEGKTEFAGTLANDIPSGKLTMFYRAPNGASTQGAIVIDTAKLTKADISVQGRNPYEKSVEWTGIIDNDQNNFTIYIA